jgi:hypothetical protein
MNGASNSIVGGGGDGVPISRMVGVGNTFGSAGPERDPPVRVTANSAD